jgi:hypothetical protein
MAFEPRAGRYLRLEDPIFNADPWGCLATTAPTGALARRLGCRSLLHAARLDPRSALQPLQPRNLLAQLCYNALLLGILVQQRQYQLLQLSG